MTAGNSIIYAVFPTAALLCSSALGRSLSSCTEEEEEVDTTCDPPTGIFLILIV